MTTSKCTYDPTKVDGSIGMHHCPVCGDMVVAGIPHPPSINDLSDEELEELSKFAKDGDCTDPFDDALPTWILKSTTRCIRCHSNNVDILQDNGSKDKPEETDMQMQCGDCGLMWAITVSEEE